MFVIAALSGVKSEKMTMIIIMPLLPSTTSLIYCRLQGVYSYPTPHELAIHSSPDTMTTMIMMTGWM